jgi:hypothetical protein
MLQAREQRKGSQYPLDRKLGGPQSLSGQHWEENILDPTGTRNLTVIHWQHSSWEIKRKIRTEQNRTEQNSSQRNRERHSRDKEENQNRTEQNRTVVRETEKDILTVWLKKLPLSVGLLGHLLTENNYKNHFKTLNQLAAPLIFSL